MDFYIVITAPLCHSQYPFYYLLCDFIFLKRTSLKWAFEAVVKNHNTRLTELM